MSKETVNLTLPSMAEYLVTVRLVAASIAGRAGFDVDEIEDMKTACSEACLLLLPHAKPSDDLTVRFEFDSDGLHATIRVPGVTLVEDGAPEAEFSRFLLEALMDEAGYFEEDGQGELRLFKAPLDA